MGWVVTMVFTTWEGGEGWYEGGVVVEAGNDGWCTVYYRSDDFHERVQVPEETVRFRVPHPGVTHRELVTPEMLPQV